MIIYIPFYKCIFFSYPLYKCVLQSSSVLRFIHFVFVYVICVFLYTIVYWIMRIKIKNRKKYVWCNADNVLNDKFCRQHTDMPVISTNNSKLIIFNFNRHWYSLRKSWFFHLMNWVNRIVGNAINNLKLFFFSSWIFLFQKYWGQLPQNNIINYYILS